MDEAELNLVLKKPLKSGDREVPALQLREPVAGDIEASAEGGNWVAAALAILARMTGLAPDALKGLAAHDLMRASAFFARWTAPGQLAAAGLAPFGDELVLPLSTPLAFGGSEIGELNLREPTAGELEEGARSVNWATTNLVVLARITALPRTVLQKLSARDFAKASEFLAGFLLPGPPTSQTASPTSPAGSDGDHATDGASPAGN